jgi:hypothetical protein
VSMTKSKWFVPAFSVTLGVAFAAAQVIGHQLTYGLVSLGIMVVFAGVFMLGGRSETIRGLRGDGRDERFAMIDLRATAFTGLAMIVVVLVAAFVSLAEGHDGQPFTWLGAVGGIAYLASIVWLRVRG